MTWSAEIESVVGPTADTMRFENALPGHACPPPCTR
jgi:hypothetical protein